MPPPGQSGFSGYSGYSGLRGATGPSGPSSPGASGFSGYSGAGLGTGNVTLTGSLTTGSASGGTGDVALSGANSGVVHLRPEADAGTGIFILPNTTGTQVIATIADLEALRAEITGLLP